MIMKKILILMVCAAVFFSCEKTPEEVSTETSELLTFSFTKDANPKLDKDYSVEIVGDKLFTIVKGGTDLTKLVASFTTTNSGKVSIDGKELISGSTKFNYLEPVDLVVKNPKSDISKQYTIVITDKISLKWAKFATFKDSNKSIDLPLDNFATALNPVTGLPEYFITRDNVLLGEDGEPVLDKDGDVEMTDAYGAVLTFDESAVASISPELTYRSDGVTKIKNQKNGIAIDADGKAYVMYYDRYKPEGADEYVNYVTVKTGSGSNWSTVGSTFGKASISSYYGMAIDPVSKYPIVGYTANASTDVLAKREWEVCTYDGASWTDNTTIDGLKGKTIYWGKYKTFNGALYFGCMDVYGVKNATGAYFIYKYENNAWVEVALGSPEGLSTSPSSVGMDFVIASDGTPYIFTAGDEAGAWNLKLYKYADAKWEQVGSNMAEAGSSTRVSMTIYKDLPVVFYKDQETSNPTILVFNSETMDWNTPFVLDDVEVYKYGGQSIDVTADGTFFVSFIDNTSDSADDGALKVYSAAL